MVPALTTFLAVTTSGPTDASSTMTGSVGLDLLVGVAAMLASAAATHFAFKALLARSRRAEARRP